MTEITSRENPAIKEFLKLCAARKNRSKSGLFPLEGVRLVCDCAATRGRIKRLFVTDEGIRRLGDKFDWLSSLCEETLRISDGVAGFMGDTETPQGVFAVCEGLLGQDGLPKAAPNGALMLCSLQDPGNVGTILRTAEALCLSFVILTRDCPDVTSPKVMRSSMGAALRIPIFLCDSAAEAVRAMREDGLLVYAAALGEQSRAVDTLDLNNAVVAIGNEGRGLEQETADACTARALLPISPESESLNAAMAAGIFAWELSKASRKKKEAAE